jgi:hypothetical protein
MSLHTFAKETLKPRVLPTLPFELNEVKLHENHALIRDILNGRFGCGRNKGSYDNICMSYIFVASINPHTSISIYDKYKHYLTAQYSSLSDNQFTLVGEFIRSEKRY